ncbi:Pseudouridine synthase family protein [Quillaja saponaria]|uniref:tRNA pseudouridine(55) synthase n=1 Tax=Quillaja saponaria TaxID=32244 RepID=A0AAD7LGZ1_QUISA|nr:Pseudouridine synthase family protein [Quillaja saponaria]
MATEIEAAKVVLEPEVAPVIYSADVNQFNGGKDDSRNVEDVVRGLPSHAVKELLSLGVCVRCIFRLFGIQGPIYGHSLLSPSILSSILGELTVSEEDNVGNVLQKCENATGLTFEELQRKVCCLCLGILQFTFYDDREVLVKKDSPKNLASLIGDMVKQEGHQIDSFSLEVSMPPDILENDQSIWLHMKTKYVSEPWFQEKLCSKCTTAKDALKYSIINSLENLLDSICSVSSFRIRLTYSHSKASEETEKISYRTEASKRRKTGTGNGVNIVDDFLLSRVQCADSFSDETVVGERPLNSMGDQESLKCCKLLLEKANEPYHFAVLFYRTPIYFGGRYLKYSRNVSQTRWIIDDERMGEASVEVRMLGSGRPFLIEVQNARHLPSEAFVKDIETEINNLENKLVGVKNLKLVGSNGWNLMHEGEAEKQKQYAAIVWISRHLKEEDMQSVSSLKDLKVLQRTPVRVLHRRSPLEREKIIHWMKIESIAGSSQYFLLHLCTQAGTYIKEFVHGDLGRTHPNVGSILGCRAEILQLDVTDVKMDCFLT